MPFRIASVVLVTVYMMTWVVRLVARRVHPVFAVPAVVAMSVGLLSDRRWSLLCFYAGFAVASFFFHGGGPWVRRRTASVAASLTDVARSALRRDVSASA